MAEGSDAQGPKSARGCAAGRHGMADVRGGRHCDPFRCLTPVLCIVIMRNSRYHPEAQRSTGPVPFLQLYHFIFHAPPLRCAAAGTLNLSPSLYTPLYVLV